MTSLCADPTCPTAWAEHDAHDNRPAIQTPTERPEPKLCTDPNCAMRIFEHDAH